MRKHILVLDYGVGNIKSIMAAFKKFENDVLLGSANKDFTNAKALIIPGVGAFRHGMDKLKVNKLDTRIREFAQEKRPIMGRIAEKYSDKFLPIKPVDPKINIFFINYLKWIIYYVDNW